MEIDSLYALMRMATQEGTVKTQAYTDNNVTICQRGLCGFPARRFLLGQQHLLLQLLNHVL